MFEDKKLMRRYNRGEVGVLRDIYGRYKDDMVGLSAALLYDKMIAEDVVHDVFARLNRLFFSRPFPSGPTIFFPGLSRF